MAHVNPGAEEEKMDNAGDEEVSTVDAKGGTSKGRFLPVPGCISTRKCPGCISTRNGEFPGELADNGQDAAAAAVEPAFMALHQQLLLT